MVMQFKLIIRKQRGYYTVWQFYIGGEGGLNYSEQLIIMFANNNKRVTVVLVAYDLFPYSIRLCGCGLAGWIRGIKGYCGPSYSIYTVIVISCRGKIDTGSMAQEAGSNKELHGKYSHNKHHRLLAGMWPRRPVPENKV